MMEMETKETRGRSRSRSPRGSRRRGLIGRRRSQVMGTPVPFIAIAITETDTTEEDWELESTLSQSITCMQEYENKSFEELRFEDYLMNRKVLPLPSAIVRSGIAISPQVQRSLYSGSAHVEPAAFVSINTARGNQCSLPNQPKPCGSQGTASFSSFESQGKSSNSVCGDRKSEINWDWDDPIPTPAPQHYSSPVRPTLDLSMPDDWERSENTLNLETQLRPHQYEDPFSRFSPGESATTEMCSTTDWLSTCILNQQKPFSLSTSSSSSTATSQPNFGTGGFGATTNTGANVFGQPAQQQPTTSLFGGGGTAFGSQQTSLPAFGAGTATASTGAFGAQPNASSVFGQQARPAAGIFSSPASTISPFSAQTQVAGTSIPFNAITGTDTMMKNGAASQINTRHQCITCMKEYENKSLEELRMEDYQMNRKGPSNPGMFGAGTTATPQAQPGAGLFSGIGGTPGVATPGTSTFGQTSAFGQTTTAGGGLFSSLNQPKPGGFFGNTATPTSTSFGGASGLGFSFNNPTSQPATSIFGQNNNNPATSNTGLGTTSAFSFASQPQQQPQNQGLGLFGQKPLTTPASTAPTFGGFGGTATNTALNKPLFGGTATAGTFGAGSTAPTFGTGSGSLFSTNTQQPQKPFSFSTPFSSTATSQPAFGATSSTSTFSFSNPVSTPAVNFGTGTAPTFGSTTGATAGSTFGAPLSFSLGSNAQQQPATSTGSTFGTGFFSSGTNNPTTGAPGTGLSLFGSGGTTGSFGTGFGAGTGLNLQPQQQQQQPLAQGAISFATTPFKDNQLFYNLISNRNIENMAKPTNPLAQRQYLEASRRKTSTGAGPSTSSTSFNLSMSPAVKNLTFPTNTKNSSIAKFKIFDGFEDEDYGVGIDILSPKTNVKKLVLKNTDIMPSSSPTSISVGENGSIGMARRASMSGISPLTNSRPGLQTPLAQNRRNRLMRLTLNSSAHNDLSYTSPENNYGEPNRTIDYGDSINEGAGPSSLHVNQSLNHSGSSEGGDGFVNGGGIGLNGGTVGGLSSKRGSEVDVGGGSFLNGSGGQAIPGQGSSGSATAGNICGVVCTRPQYYLVPSLEELDRMTDANGNCVVRGLEIGRANFGRIKYVEPVNIANINIDQIVFFRHKEVTVYPEDRNKPENGEGLNVPAEIELERVWPLDRSTNELIRNPEEIQKLDYESWLRKACARTGSEFISYNIESGTWKFKVSHFSKYGCDEEEDLHAQQTAAQNEKAAQQSTAPKGLGGIPQQKLQQQQQQQRKSTVLGAAGGGALTGPSGDASAVSPRPQKPALVQPKEGGDKYPMANLLNQMVAQAHKQLRHPMETGHPPASDVELNPLTPCDSDDEDDDDLEDDEEDELENPPNAFEIRRPSVRLSTQPEPQSLRTGQVAAPLPKYKPILKDCGTEKSRMLKSVLSIDDFDEEPSSFSLLDTQPPTKKSRPIGVMAVAAADLEHPDSGQRLKKRLSMLHAQSPPMTSTPRPEFLPNPAAALRPKEPVQLSDQPVEDLFSVLKPSSCSNAVRLQGSTRVCFLPNGQFLTVSPSASSKSGINKQVNINQLVSYAEKQETAPLSETYRAVLEKQMLDRLDKEGVLFQEHITAIQAQLRSCEIVQVKREMESELVIWELCDILWPGELDIESGFVQDDGFLLCQRKRLGHWIRKHGAVLFGDCYDKSDKSVLGLLKKGLHEGASDAALQEGNLWLAVAIETSPHLLLNFQDDPSVLDGMPKDSSDVFSIVSGNLRNLSWLNGNMVREMTTFQWFQHFGLYIWYEGPVRTLLPVSVERAVREFEGMMREIAEDDECPLPDSESSSIANLAMHLLKLYSCTGYPMNIVLAPRTWTLDCLDYKLDWLLMRSLEEIGYSPGDDVYKGVCLGFTGMLDGIGMWKWCQFVMSHIPGPDCEAEDIPEEMLKEKLAQEAFCQRIMERYIGEEGMATQEEFLVYQLRVSEMLIYSTRSWKSRMSGRKREDLIMWYLGNMEQWQEAFGVMNKFMESGMALDLIGGRLPGQARNILQHLMRMEDNKERIVGWDVNGKMLVNYLKMQFAKDDVDSMEAAVVSFMESVIKFKPANIHQCAFLLDMALSAQKMIQLLLAEPAIIADRRTRIEDNLVQLLDITAPKEYFDGLRCFINFSMGNVTAPFRPVMDGMEMMDDDMGAANLEDDDGSGPGLGILVGSEFRITVRR